MEHPDGWVKILERNIDTTGKHPKSLCLCTICGSVFVSVTRHIVSGSVKSCGCLASLKGTDETIGKILQSGIVVVGYISKSKWRVRYVCGHHGDVTIDQVSRSKTGLCFECSSKIPKTIKHGHSKRAGASKTYSIWCNMRRRCNEETNNRYYAYGARGVEVCERWENSFENFLEDMGECPSDYHTIERKDVNGNYEPENCYWLLSEEQGWNKTNTIRVYFEGICYSLRHACKMFDLNYKYLWHRLRKYSEDITKYFPQGVKIVLPENY